LEGFIAAFCLRFRATLIKAAALMSFWFALVMAILGALASGQFFRKEGISNHAESKSHP